MRRRCPECRCLTKSGKPCEYCDRHYESLSKALGLDSEFNDKQPADEPKDVPLDTPEDIGREGNARRERALERGARRAYDNDRE